MSNTIQFLSKQTRQINGGHQSKMGSIFSKLSKPHKPKPNLRVIRVREYSPSGDARFRLGGSARSEAPPTSAEVGEIFEDTEGLQYVDRFVTVDTVPIIPEVSREAPVENTGQVGNINGDVEENENDNDLEGDGQRLEANNHRLAWADGVVYEDIEEIGEEDDEGEEENVDRELMGSDTDHDDTPDEEHLFAGAVRRRAPVEFSNAIIHKFQQLYLDSEGRYITKGSMDFQSYQKVLVTDGKRVLSANYHRAVIDAVVSCISLECYDIEERRQQEAEPRKPRHRIVYDYLSMKIFRFKISMWTNLTWRVLRRGNDDGSDG